MRRDYRLEDGDTSGSHRLRSQARDPGSSYFWAYRLSRGNRLFESPTPIKLIIKGLIGERGRNRTYNLLIKSQLLCQLSYAPILTKRIRLEPT